MDAIHPAGPLIGSLVALGALTWSLRQRRRHRLLADLPTSKVRGVFIGLVELNGTAESEAPLTSFLAGKRCVDYRWSVEEHWRRTRTETYTDSKGNRRTRTRTDTGWDTVASGGDQQPFYLRDDTGVILVHPAGASIDRAPMFDATVTRGDSLYYGKGPGGSVSGSTGRRRFSEEGIPLHAALYLVGDARERPDIVAPQIADADGAEFIISTRGEERVRGGLAVGSWALWMIGLFATPIALFIAAHASDFPPPSDLLIRWALLATAAYFAIWAAAWAWMVHDSIIGLRERVRSAWSLIDVQLKRRHDLLPTLNRAIAALSTHEADTQAALAALREVAPESWTGGGIKSKGSPRCRRNVVRSAPSSRRRWALRPSRGSSRSM